MSPSAFIRSVPMSVSSISLAPAPTYATGSTTTTAPAHHGHRSRSSESTGGPGSTSSSTSTSGTSKSTESLQQLADQGDPIAIDELRAEDPSQGKGGADPSSPTTPTGGATEPGKGEQVDVYA